MANTFITLPVNGAPQDTSTLGLIKTITVSKDFSGTIQIEASNDGGISFFSVRTLDRVDRKVVIPVVAQWMRAVRQGAGAGEVRVAAETTSDGKFVTLALPAGVGPGAPSDISDFGSSTTTIVTGTVFNALGIEVSEDDVEWIECLTFTGRGLRSKTFTGKSARVVRKPSVNAFTVPSGPLRVSIGAIPDDSAGTNLDFGDPITVRGPTNAQGGSGEVADAEHDHRLEYEVEDEGVLVSARPRSNAVGDGVGVVDDPINDRTIWTIPGPNLGDGGAVVKRSTYVATPTSTSSLIYVDGMSGGSVVVPIDGDYWVMFESEGENQSNGIEVCIGISVNSLVAVVAASERNSEGNASDTRPLVTTVQILGLTAGDLIRCLYKRVGGGGGPQMVAMERRHLTIMKVQ